MKKDSEALLHLADSLSVPTSVISRLLHRPG